MNLINTTLITSRYAAEITGHHPSESLGFIDTECIEFALNEVIWSSWPAISGSSQS